MGYDQPAHINSVIASANALVIVYDYTPTRSRAGPAKFLEGYQGYLQADAYSVYDAFLLICILLLEFLRHPKCSQL